MDKVVMPQYGVKKCNFACDRVADSRTQKRFEVLFGSAYRSEVRGWRRAINHDAYQWWLRQTTVPSWMPWMYHCGAV